MVYLNIIVNMLFAFPFGVLAIMLIHDSAECFDKRDGIEGSFLVVFGSLFALVGAGIVIFCIVDALMVSGVWQWLVK